MLTKNCGKNSSKSASHYWAKHKRNIFFKSNCWLNHYQIMGILLLPMT